MNCFEYLHQTDSLKDYVRNYSLEGSFVMIQILFALEQLVQYSDTDSDFRGKVSITLVLLIFEHVKKSLLYVY